jgi:hypothetical protein
VSAAGRVVSFSGVVLKSAENQFSVFGFQLLRIAAAVRGRRKN